MFKGTVWSVYHDFEDDGFCEHFKLIGFFYTREKARAVVRHLRTMPGFSDHKRGFLVGRQTLNGGSWEEGFHTVIGDRIMPEPDIPSDLPTVLDRHIEHSDDGLWHVLHSYRDQWNCTETKPIGLYSDLELAKNAVKNLMMQPGFRSRPFGFEIHPVTIGKVAYESGF